MTNGHLTRYQPGDYISVTRGKEFQNVIAHLFVKSKGRGSESALRRKWLKC